MNTPELQQVTFEFSQEGNCLNGGDESITIQVRADLGIEKGGGFFFEISTDGWSIDSKEEMNELFDRVSRAVNGMVNDGGARDEDVTEGSSEGFTYDPFGRRVPVEPFDCSRYNKRPGQSCDLNDKCVYPNCYEGVRERS
jgi:hypothetical protein